MTAREFRLVVPMNRLINSNDREHWAPKAAKTREMRAAACRVCADLAPIAGAVRLTVTFAFPDRRRRDLDNVSIKAAVDGAVDAGLISDDRSTVLRSVTRQRSELRSPKGYAVLTFEFRPDGEAV